MLSKIDISGCQFFIGACEKLLSQTAIVNVSLDVPVQNVPLLAERIRTFIPDLRAGDPLTLTPANSWPEAFLIDADQQAGMGDWLVALTIAIQRWARDPVALGRVVTHTDQSFVLALPWQRRDICEAALQWAAGYLLLWSQPTLPSEAYRAFNENFERWLVTAQQGGLSPSSARFALSANSKEMPVLVRDGVVKIGWGAAAMHLDGTFTGHTSLIASVTARNKFRTSQLLSQAGLPVPFTSLVASWPEALDMAKKIGWPVVIKPSNQDQGLAVVADINNETLLKHSFDAANQYSPGAVIVERHIEGDDHRMLVVGGKLLAVAKRIPAGVVGDGIQSIEQLVAKENTNPMRGLDVRSSLIALKLDQESATYLAERGLTRESVPGSGQFVRLARTSNLSKGGTAVDVMSHVHPDNRFMAERAARLVGLDIAGVDFICPDIARSWRETGAGICEVNAQPGLRPHWISDPARDVNGDILERLLGDRSPRIPTAAITGTNGKSTTARMLHHIWMTSGKVAGVCTTQGVWIGHDHVSEDNLSGQPGAAIVLQDPAVESAIIEMPRKGLLCFGHPCDQYDVAALLNVQDDHIGVLGVDSLEQMAQLKAQVLERATLAVVINAEDALCLKMREKSGARRHILVAHHADNQEIAAHRLVGGEAVFLQYIEESLWLMFARGEASTAIMPVHDIPATLGGLLRFNQTNALFAAALAWAQGLDVGHIRSGLGSFYNSAEQNPGRYNFIEYLPFRVLVDFGHNPDNLRELFSVVRQIKPKDARCVLVSTVGNRHRHQLEQSAPWYAETFDDIYLSQVQEEFNAGAQGYGETDPFSTMLRLAESLIRPLLAAQQTLSLVGDAQLALQIALSSCRPGDFLVMLTKTSDAFQALKNFTETSGRD